MNKSEQLSTITSSTSPSDDDKAKKNVCSMSFIETKNLRIELFYFENVNNFDEKFFFQRKREKREKEKEMKQKTIK